MRVTWPALTAAILFSFLGVWLSGQLLAKHMGKSSGLLSALCGGDDGGAGCDTVLSSRWAYFPPTESEPGVQVRRVPVAWLGQAYFSLLLVWYVFVGRPSRGRAAWHFVPLLVNLIGLLWSIWFAYVMKTRIGAWCPLCLMSHGANGLLFISTMLLMPRKPRAAAGDAGHVDDVNAPQHPSVRLALAAVLLGWAMGVMQFNGMKNATLRAQNVQMRKYLADLQGNVSALLGLFRASEQQEIALRADDPSRFGTAGAPEVVAWSDFQCPNCAKFAEHFDDVIAPMFDGSVRFVFRHYPLDPSCNPNVKGKGHPQACEMATMVEAARVVGGDAAFWRAHDLLFAAGTSKQPVTVALLADELGLDAGAIGSAMSSQAVADRIREDIEQAKSLGVRSTPTVFLDGRKVDSLTRSVDAFWEKVAGTYKKARAINAARQQAATQGSQGQPDVP